MPQDTWVFKSLAPQLGLVSFGSRVVLWPKLPTLCLLANPVAPATGSVPQPVAPQEGHQIRLVFQFLSR